MSGYTKKLQDAVDVEQVYKLDQIHDSLLKINEFSQDILRRAEKANERLFGGMTDEASDAHRVDQDIPASMLGVIDQEITNILNSLVQLSNQVSLLTTL